MRLNQSPDLDRAFQHRTSPGSLFFHEPQEARLASFDAKSPFRHTYTKLVSQPSPAGPQNRRRFVHSLASLDSQLMFDGGWLLPLGQEDDLRSFVDVYRRLPAQPFTTVVGSTQPVTIRTCVLDNETYVYLVNDSPWNARVILPASGPEGVHFEALGSRRLPQLEGLGAKRAWSLDLGPYDLVAAKFSGGPVTFSNPRVELDEEVVASLDAKIKDLWARAASLKIPAPLVALSNGDFEALPAPMVRSSRGRRGSSPKRNANRRRRTASWSPIAAIVGRRGGGRSDQRVFFRAAHGPRFGVGLAARER